MMQYTSRTRPGQKAPEDPLSTTEADRCLLPRLQPVPLPQLRELPQTDLRLPTVTNHCDTQVTKSRYHGSESHCSERGGTRKLFVRGMGCNKQLEHCLRDRSKLQVCYLHARLMSHSWSGLRTHPVKLQRHVAVSDSHRAAAPAGIDKKIRHSASYRDLCSELPSSELR